jgi:lipoprotein-anchoring transpeptidase ErfK/SrfK
VKEPLNKVRAYIATHRRDVAIVLVVVVLFTAGLAVAASMSSPPPAAEPSARSTPESTPTAEPSPSPSAVAQTLRPGEIVATVAGEELAVYAAPGDTQTTQVLDKWSKAAFQPLTVIAVDTADVDGSTWLQVLLPVQPNGSTGWIRESDVAISSTTVEIHIYLDERELDVVDGGEVLLTATVAIGTEETPTPPGVYSVTDRLEYPNPNHAYGAFALGLSGFSEVLDSFQGAPPQLAIHGTNQPDLIGDRVSNGCIRLPNDVVVAVAEHAQLGTPVIIHDSRTDME